MNSYIKVFAILLAVLLLYIYPIYTAFQQQDDISELVVLRATTAFVDAVRDKGYISPTMYTDFRQTIEATGLDFDVQMEHESKKYVPVYDDPTRPETFQVRMKCITMRFTTLRSCRCCFPVALPPETTRQEGTNCGGRYVHRHGQKCEPYARHGLV